MKRDFSLVACDEFTTGVKLRLRWGGSFIVINAINDYVFQEIYLQTGDCDDTNGSQLFEPDIVEGY